MTAGTPSWVMFNSVPQETFSSVIVVCISPGRFGSSNLSVLTNAFVRRQFDVYSAERVALARAEIRERHLVSAADFGVQVMNLARESVRWKPFDHGVRIEERAINSLRRRPEHSVESDGVCVGRWHDLLCVKWFSLLWPHSFAPR